jgi:predicted nuclease of predicted toxin-antitoxin system
MNLLANENIPFLTIKKLRTQGYDVFSISENMAGITDSEVLNLAREQNRIIITFDRDYGELIFLKKLPCPPAVIYLHFVPQSPDDAFEMIEEVLKNDKNDVLNHFVTVNRQYLRKRPLPC